jgi:hypothetical protein
MPHLMCRHIMPTGELCQSPAVTRRRFCYHHSRQRSITARPKRYGSVRIPFQFPEDRASIQINFHLAAQAVVEGKLEPRQANAITSAYRAAAANLKAGPLAPPRLKHPVERIILTPDEEEIAPAREVCLPGENLTHGPLCPCLYCAETLRNAPGELHHPDCDCGLCHEEEQQAEQEEHKDQPEEQREQEEQMQEQEDEKHDEQDRNLTPAQSAPSDEPLRNSQSSPHPLRPHTSQQSEESAVEQPLSHPQPAPQTGTSSAPASRVGVDGEKSVTLAQQSDESALAAEPSEESVTPAQPSKKSALAAEPSEESVTPAQQSKKSALAAERDAAIRALYQAAEAELAAQTPQLKPAPVAATIPTLLAAATNTPKHIKRAPTVTAPPLTLPEVRDEPAQESEPSEESQPSYQSVLRQYRAELNHPRQVGYLPSTRPPRIICAS